MVVFPSHKFLIATAREAIKIVVGEDLTDFRIRHENDIQWYLAWVSVVFFPARVAWLLLESGSGMRGRVNLAELVNRHQSVNLGCGDRCVTK